MSNLHTGWRAHWVIRSVDVDVLQDPPYHLGSKGSHDAPLEFPLLVQAGELDSGVASRPQYDSP
jgi:hypothetical protein